MALWVLLFAGGLVSDAAARELPGPVPAQVVRVIDGDTVRVRAEIWPGQMIEAVVRLAGIAAPEVRRTCPQERRAGVKSRAYLAGILTQGRKVILTNVKSGKYYGRVIARMALADGTDIGARMLAAAYAVPYRPTRRHFRERLCAVSARAQS